MNSIVKRLAYRLWPPYEARVADQEIERKNPESGPEADLRWITLLSEIRNTIPQDVKSVELEKMANQIEESELRRKDVLEDKASSFIIGVGVILALLSVLQSLFSDNQFSPLWLTIIGLVYLLAVVHLFAAVYYAIKTRRVAPLASHTATGFLESVKDDAWKIEDRLVRAIGQAKWNEGTLLRKSNYLSVTETLFVRALFLIALAIILSITIRIFAQFHSGISLGCP